MSPVEDAPHAIQMSERIVGRLSTYRRLLLAALAEEKSRVYSYELARMADFTPAQVRRDIMTIGFSGSPARGYDAAGLLRRISELLDHPEGHAFALIGVGRLGQALLAHFDDRHPTLRIVAAFDVDPAVVGRDLHGCHCYGVDELEPVIRQRRITLALIAVPAEAAQTVANRLVAAGVRGLLNFAPTHLNVPERVHVEDVDITVALERVAFFSRTPAPF